MTHTALLRLARASTLAALLGLGPIAHAQDAVYDTAPLVPGLQLSLKLEPGLSVALADPQPDRSELGMGDSAQLLFGMNRYLAIGPSFAFTTAPRADLMSGSERAYAFGAGGRLMRPHDAIGYGISPWIDANALYVRTGGLDRPGLAFGTGVSMPFDVLRRYWVGPFARYSQIFDANARDAKMLTFGVGLEVTTGVERKRTPRVLALTDPEPVTPAVAEKVAVEQAMFEVTEKISFLWDSAKLEDSSFPALDKLVVALQDHQSVKVQIDGHASSEGLETHNQTLSEQRAEAVLDYLVTRGVARDRLVSKGFSSSQPLETNTTEVGRESNRRVEFVVEVKLLD